MPTLQLTLSAPQDQSRHHSLAQALTRITAERLGKRAEVTAVLVHEAQATHWYIGSAPVQRPTALLEISITAGTNSEQQKADFVAAAYAELEAQLGRGQGLELASYVIVREVTVTDWGYGGRTQAQRRTDS